jgi:biopolymer transport protein ExbD
MASIQQESRWTAPPEGSEPALEAIEEEVGLPRRRVRDDSEMDITPMIDMTFLLLIFFLVASRMDERAAVVLPPARHGNAVSTTGAVVFTIGGDSEEAQIFKGEGKIPANLLSAGDTEGKESEIAAYVEEIVAGDPTIQNVVILAEAGVKHRDVALVMKAVGLAETDGNQLHVAVLEMR